MFMIFTFINLLLIEDILEYSVEGEYLKTFKTEKGAMNFAKKAKYPVL